MSNDKASFAATLREIGDERARRLVAHPEPSLLAEYQRGELAEPDQAALQEHLAICGECTKLLLDLSVLAGEGVAPATPKELEAGWQDLGVRLAMTVVPSRLATVRPAVEKRLPRQGAPAYVLAASALLGMGLALIWGLIQQRELRRLTRPLPNVSFYELEDPGAARDPEVPPVRVVLSQSAPQATLLLHPPVSPDAEAYLATILDGRGRSRWSSDRLEPDAYGRFTLGLSRGSLAPGSYVIEISGRRGERESLMGRFRFEVVER